MFTPKVCVGGGGGEGGAAVFVFHCLNFLLL